jgi:predicted metal-binding protein
VPKIKKGLKKMDLRERLIEAFTKLGFDEYREIKVDNIVFSQDVFNQCARNTCGNFGKNHACPPGAGTEEERKARVRKYDQAFILCKIISILSGDDMMESMGILGNLNKALRKEFAAEDVLILGAGPCTLCEKCSALDGEPCRFPDKKQYSMEGNGIDVVRMSMDQKMTYNAGMGKVGFFSLVLYNH